MGHNRIDRLDKKILNIISKDARVPFLEVARDCGVSGAAIHQRIQKLKNNGVIKRSEFVIDTYKIGYETCAYIGITLTNLKKLNPVVEALREIPEIVECHYATGKYSIFIKIYAKDNRRLLRLILDDIIPIDGVENTETFQLSLDELFNRQLSVFEVEETPHTEE